MGSKNDKGLDPDPDPHKIIRNNKQIVSREGIGIVMLMKSLASHCGGLGLEQNTVPQNNFTVLASETSLATLVIFLQAKLVPGTLCKVKNL